MREACPVRCRAVTTLPPGGTVRPITRWGEPVMHRRLTLVTDFDRDLARLVADMCATMYAAEGVGLAANQIGIDAAVFVFDCPDENGDRRRGVVCNPVLTLPEGKDRQLDDTDEGCLSLPGAFVSCPRPDVATVAGVDHTGEPVSYTGSGLLARCLQHETDHVFGTVFADRLAQRARKQLLKEAGEHADDYPPGWPASTDPSHTQHHRMPDLRYTYRPDDDRDRLLAAVRDAGYEAHEESGVEPVSSLIVGGADDREAVRELLQAARQPAGRPQSLLFDDELAGGG